MELTDEFVQERPLTALMITHHMEDALKYGNRLIVMREGQDYPRFEPRRKSKMKISRFIINSLNKVGKWEWKWFTFF